MSQLCVEWEPEESVVVDDETRDPDDPNDDPADESEGVDDPETTMPTSAATEPGEESEAESSGGGDASDESESSEESESSGGSGPQLDLADDGGTGPLLDLGGGDLPTEFSAISVGDTHACALDTEGYAVCWGQYSAYVGWPLTPLESVEAGPGYSCGLNADGRLYCWGDLLPDLPDSFLSGAYTKVALLREAVCGLAKGSRDVECSSLEAGGPPRGEYRDIAGGWEHACAIEAQTRDVVCWGDNSFGQMPQPEIILKADAIVADSNWSCLTDSDNAKCWGIRDYSPGSVGTPGPVPGVPPAGNTTPTYAFVRISVGFEHGCGVATQSLDFPEYLLRCWYYEGIRGKTWREENTMTEYVKVDSGGGVSCMIRADDRSIDCLGESDWGVELGL